MPNTLNYKSNPNFNTQRYAISYLLKRIGDRVDMNYTCNGSAAGTKDKGQYAFNNFGYVNNDMDYKAKSYYNYNSWVNILKNEIDNGRPILYIYIGKHTFVCDGYEYGTHSFHFNLGWNGYLNGFYDYEDLKIDNVFDFSTQSNQACFTGIHPDWQTTENLQNVSIITNSSDQWPNKQTYQAQSITVAGNNTTFNIGNGSDGRLVASQGIDLLPGFWAKPGSTMLVKGYSNSQGTTMKSYFEESVNTENQQTISETPLLVTDSIIHISVYPNPSSDGKVTISSSLTINENSLIEIYNLIGQKIVSVTEYNFISKAFDLSKYPKGLYTFKISNNSSMFMSKLLYQ